MLELFKKGSKFSRASATMLCLLWIVGFVFCQTQCLAISSHTCHAGQTDGHSSDHDKVPCHGPSSDSKSEEAISCCCSVDVINPVLEKVEWHMPSEWLLVALISNEWGTSGEIESNLTIYFQNSPWLEWVLTPELRLGPAIRSHAPPQNLIS